ASCSAFKTCQPPLSAISDDFNDGFADPSIWRPYADSPGEAFSFEGGGQLGITVPAWDNGYYAGYYSSGSYGCLDSQAAIELVTPGNIALANYETYFLLERSNRNWMGF